MSWAALTATHEIVNNETNLFTSQLLKQPIGPTPT